MATLRIEVHGQHFEVDIPAARVEIGSGPSADLRLDVEGVASAHCTLEPLGEDRLKVRDAGSGLETRVAGAVVRQASLKVGQVLALGPARLTLLTCEAAPAPVTAPPPAAASAAPPPGRIATRPPQVRRPAASARGTPERKGSGLPSWAIALGALALLGAVGFLALRGEDKAPTGDAGFERVNAAIEAGELDVAEELVASLRTRADGDSDHLREVERLARRVARRKSNLDQSLASVWALRRDLAPELLAQRRSDIERSFGRAGERAFDDFAKRLRADNAAWLEARVAAVDAKGKQFAAFQRFAPWMKLWTTFEQTVPSGVDAKTAIEAGKARVVAAAEAAAERLSTRVEAELQEGLGLFPRGCEQLGASRAWLRGAAGARAADDPAGTRACGKGQAVHRGAQRSHAGHTPRWPASYPHGPHAPHG